MLLPYGRDKFLVFGDRVVPPQFNYLPPLHVSDESSTGFGWVHFNSIRPLNRHATRLTRTGLWAPVNLTKRKGCHSSVSHRTSDCLQRQTAFPYPCPTFSVNPPKQKGKVPSAISPQVARRRVQRRLRKRQHTRTAWPCRRCSSSCTCLCQCCCRCSYLR